MRDLFEVKNARILPLLHIPLSADMRGTIYFHIIPMHLTPPTPCFHIIIIHLPEKIFQGMGSETNM